MTITVKAADHEFEVDVSDESVDLVLRGYGMMTVREFSCDGLYVKNRKSEFVPLHDYLIEQAIELAAENASEDFANGQADYNYDTQKGD